MKKIKIMVDTSADMPKELMEKYDIGLINFMVTFGDESFVAGEEMTNEQFYARIRETGVHPKTAQTPYQAMYDKLLAESEGCETLIYFTISSKASGQNHTAHLALKEIKEENPDADIRIVDTGRFSLYIAGAAVLAAQLAEKGKTPEEIIEEAMKYMAEREVYLVVDDLNYLQKGGRITKATAIVGSLLDIKPVMNITDGLIAPVAKLRGKKKICRKLIEMIKETPSFRSENPEFMVVHSNEDYGNEMTAALEEEFGKGVIYMKNEFGPIIGTHTGPGALAVLFAIKE